MALLFSRGPVYELLLCLVFRFLSSGTYFNSFRFAAAGGSELPTWISFRFPKRPHTNASGDEGEAYAEEQMASGRGRGRQPFRSYTISGQIQLGNSLGRPPSYQAKCTDTKT